MSEKILECRNLTKIFSYGKTSSLKAVDSLSLSIKKGETYGLVGECGSGKSTLANMICALEKPTSGEIFFNGEELSSLRGKNLLDFRKKMQIVFQDPYA